jgi:single-stranded-DNA-specific exonuclease
VGIVASRIAEEYCCPTFLISLDGEHGKASSRSYGGFNLFSSLGTLSHLLESYGGHELAAGFTIRRSQIPAFREAICRLAGEYYAAGELRTVLDADCTVTPDLLTMANIDALNILEPCGNGCPKPVLVMEGMQIERISTVGNGRHLRLRLRHNHYAFPAIFFSCTAQSASVCEGELVDVAFMPQINEFRGEKTVQLNLVDIRPSCKAPVSPKTHGYAAMRSGDLCGCDPEALLPDRQTLGMIWRYLAAARDGIITEAPICLCRKIVRRTGNELSLGRLLTALDIFREVGLIEVQSLPKHITIRMIPTQEKADLMSSPTMQKLLSAAESE